VHAPEVDLEANAPKELNLEANKQKEIGQTDNYPQVQSFSPIHKSYYAMSA